MRILQINKFYYVEGGAERYFRNISSLLINHGHRVAYFSMHDLRNPKTRWQKYFISNISFRDIDLRRGFRILKRMVYSLEAKSKINELLDEFTPDIVHIHQIYNHISPSILPEIKKREIPIVQTIHDYHLLAPNRNLFHDGEICEITKPDKYYKAILHKCVKKSYLATLANITTLYIHKIFGLYSKNVDYYIAPSLFVKNKLIEYGFDSQKIIQLPNFIDKSSYSSFEEREKKDKYVLYFGRLSSEKGLLFLFEVTKKLPSLKFKLAGEGPQREILKRDVRTNSLSNIEFLGYQTGERLKQIILDSYFTILPSLWYEPFGLSILESFACGKPVIASRIGGIPEVVKDGLTGFLFEPGNLQDCINKVKRLWNNPYLVKKMGQSARLVVETKYNPEKHYRQLLKIYQRAIEINNKKNE